MNNLSLINQALKNIGILYDDLNEYSILKEFIEDSLSFVSFFVEIENLFDIELPDEFYSNKTLEVDMNNFIKIISKCKGGDINEI